MSRVSLERAGNTGARRSPLGVLILGGGLGALEWRQKARPDLHNLQILTRPEEKRKELMVHIIAEISPARGGPQKLISNVSYTYLQGRYITSKRPAACVPFAYFHWSSPPSTSVPSSPWLPAFRLAFACLAALLFSLRWCFLSSIGILCSLCSTSGSPFSSGNSFDISGGNRDPAEPLDSIFTKLCPYSPSAPRTAYSNVRRSGATPSLFSASAARSGM